MYQLNTRAVGQSDRAAEDTQLYQVVTVSRDRLEYRAHAVTGRLYDAFEILRTHDGNRIVWVDDVAMNQRLCMEGVGPRTGWLAARVT